MLIAVPQSNSSQKHKENQREDHKHRKESACWDIEQMLSWKLHGNKSVSRYIKYFLTVADDRSTVHTASWALLVA